MGHERGLQLRSIQNRTGEHDRRVAFPASFAVAIDRDAPEHAVDPADPHRAVCGYRGRIVPRRGSVFERPTGPCRCPDCLHLLGLPAG